jgi:hypothetical protein
MGSITFLRRNMFTSPSLPSLPFIISIARKKVTEGNWFPMEKGVLLRQKLPNEGKEMDN